MAVEFRIAAADDIGLLIQSRMETLRDVNHLEKDYSFGADFLESSRKYFLEGDQTTILAMDGCLIAGCATICYINLMPTFSHPSGKRAHLMNVYTNKDYRRKGIACHMVSALIEEAWSKGVTEISLDATDAGKPLYRKLGFTESGEYMVLGKKVQPIMEVSHA